MQAKILYNKQILPLYYKLGITWQPLPNIQPGQFIMLRINDRIDPLLRRPFGIYKTLGTGRKKEGIEIVYKVVGKGTTLMAGLKPGDAVDVLGPLGNGFPPIGRVGSAHRIIMVAGGIGIAPFYLLAERLKAKGFGQRLLFGGCSTDDLPGIEDFQELGINMEVATDDGSMGKKGFVTSLLKKETLGKAAVIYACGPKGMLKEVARIAENSDAPCYVSLDNVMACGIGACLGCAVKIRSQESEVRSQESKTFSLQPSAFSPYKMVCKDGPIFDAGEIEWEEV